MSRGIIAHNKIIASRKLSAKRLKHLMIGSARTGSARLYMRIFCRSVKYGPGVPFLNTPYFPSFMVIWCPILSWLSWLAVIHSSFIKREGAENAMMKNRAKRKIMICSEYLPAYPDRERDPSLFPFPATYFSDPATVCAPGKRVAGPVFPTSPFLLLITDNTHHKTIYFLGIRVAYCPHVGKMTILKSPV
ncbi:hypothetical protein [Methanoregula sp.]|uniref:hypothetical protein n=1 Tax=Methanoregula sp. TaxID=2052170 RepID=UPI00237068B3|nr:hypothetical protein [Methanoregula sp.]MDD1687067.1 hypothetical protein [Methanoregula sp.]